MNTNDAPSPGIRLLDFKTQESYYTKIVERYMTFCSDAGERDELLRRFAAVDLKDSNNDSIGNKHNNNEKESQPHSLHQSPRVPMSNTGPTPSTQVWSRGLPRTPTSSSSTVSSIVPKGNTQALTEVLSALRKLREGIVASKRMDEFAVQAYLFCIRLSVLVKHPESYHPAILHLLHHVTTVPPPAASTPVLAATPVASAASDSASTLSRRGSVVGGKSGGMTLTSVELSEIVSYLVLDAACRRGDLAEAHAQRRRWGLRDARVDAALRALAHDNWVEFTRLRRRADGHRARILEYADARLRRHALKCFARSYFSVDLPFLERSMGSTWARLTADDGVGWELEDDGVVGKRVVIRRVKSK